MILAIDSIMDNASHTNALKIAGLVVAGALALLFIGWIQEHAEQPRIRYFFRKNKLEIRAFIFAAIGYCTAYVFSDQPGWRLTISVAVTLTATIIVVYSKTRDRDFYFLPLQGPNEKDDWMGEGTFQYERIQNSYIITKSYSGFIFSKSLTWSDYLFDFEFKILNVSIGAIVRATNLSNLVMLQIFDNGIKAHIRVNGLWKDWDPATANLQFSNKLDLDHWYRCRLECDKRSIRIRLHDMAGSQKFDREWIIPQGIIAFQILDASPEGQITRGAIPFPINLEYGTIGFRNDGMEKSAVRNVLIDKLQRGR
jgi:hypothetical protein